MHLTKVWSEEKSEEKEVGFLEVFGHRWFLLSEGADSRFVFFFKSKLVISVLFQFGCDGGSVLCGFCIEH